MTAEFKIIINSEEPPPDGTNLTVHSDQDMRMGRFSLAAVADAVTKLQALLQEHAPAPAALAQPCAILYQALFAGVVGEAWRDCLTLAAERKTRLRLRICTESTALLAIPWEYLYDKSNQRWLALQPDLSLVRGLPVQQRPPQPVTGLMRVLVMLANPSDLPQLDSAQELANLTLATTTAAVELIVIEPTYRALQEALRRQPHVFHFVGHGFFGATLGIDPGTDPEATAQGQLFFCDAAGKAELIEGDRLAPLLASCTSLGLVVLNACEGAVGGAHAPFAGLAQRLLQQGLPAVLAMQAPILDSDALSFSREFYAASQRIISGGSDGIIRIWDTDTGQLFAQLDGHTESVSAVAFSHDGQNIVSGSYDNTIRLWVATFNDAQILQPTQINGHTNRVDTLAFSPDGQRIVSGSDDTTLCLWDADTGKQLAQFNGHTEWVNAIAFSPDGQRLASGSLDHTLRLWDPSTGQMLLQFEGNT